MGQWLEKARPLLSLVTPSPLPRWQERSSHHPPRPAWDSRSQLDVVGQASLEAGSGFSVEPGDPSPQALPPARQPVPASGTPLPCWLCTRLNRATTARQPGGHSPRARAIVCGLRGRCRLVLTLWVNVKPA